jgi:hypothetical protein
MQALCGFSGSDPLCSVDTHAPDYTLLPGIRLQLLHNSFNAPRGVFVGSLGCPVSWTRPAEIPRQRLQGCYSLPYGLLFSNTHKLTTTTCTRSA